MRKPEDIRFELRTNQNLSRRNLTKAYERWKICETPIGKKKSIVERLKNAVKKFLRKCMWWFIEPYWIQQREYNKALADLVQDYDRIHSLIMEENDALRISVEQLRVQIAQLNEKVEMKTVFSRDSESGRVIQVVSSLNFGDAVGNDALAIKQMLEEEGYATGIFALAIHPKIRGKNIYRMELLPELTEKDVIIYHYAAADELREFFEYTPARVILRYHNVTPSIFFHGYDDNAEKITKEGIEQIEEMRNTVDYGLTVSEFNKQDLIKMGYNCPISVVPILIPFDDYKQKPSESVVEKYSDGITNIVFVGRVVPNKKFEDVIACFAAYKKTYDMAARLFLVGSYQETDKYYRYLKKYIEDYGINDVIFPGHISFDEILAYYKVANIFLCMSEHEGFCVPLIEAMFFEIPIVAYASTAIPGTLGGSGVVVDTKEPDVVAGIINRIQSDAQYKRNILERQRQRLDDFAYVKIKGQILENLEHVL